MKPTYQFIFGRLWPAGEEHKLKGKGSRKENRFWLPTEYTKNSFPKVLAYLSNMGPTTILNQ